MIHEPGAGEPSDQKSHPADPQVICRLDIRQFGGFCGIQHEQAHHTYLCPHIKKLGGHPPGKMAMPEGMKNIFTRRLLIRRGGLFADYIDE